MGNILGMKGPRLRMGLHAPILIERIHPRSGAPIRCAARQDLGLRVRHNWSLGCRWSLGASRARRPTSLQRDPAPVAQATTHRSADEAPGETRVILLRPATVAADVGVAHRQAMVRDGRLRREGQPAGDQAGADDPSGDGAGSANGHAGREAGGQPSNECPRHGTAVPRRVGAVPIPAQQIRSRRRGHAAVGPRLPGIGGGPVRGRRGGHDRRRGHGTPCPRTRTPAGLVGARAGGGAGGRLRHGGARVGADLVKPAHAVPRGIGEGRRVPLRIQVPVHGQRVRRPGRRRCRAA